MCDYSLHVITSRPAKVGDKLISTRFPLTHLCEGQRHTAAIASALACHGGRRTKAPFACRIGAWPPHGRPAIFSLEERSHYACVPAVSSPGPWEQRHANLSIAAENRHHPLDTSERSLGRSHHCRERQEQGSLKPGEIVRVYPDRRR